MRPLFLPTLFTLVVLAFALNVTFLALHVGKESSNANFQFFLLPSETPPYPTTILNNNNPTKAPSLSKALRTNQTSLFPLLPTKKVSLRVPMAEKITTQQTYIESFPYTERKRNRYISQKSKETFKTATPLASNLTKEAIVNVVNTSLTKTSLPKTLSSTNIFVSNQSFPIHSSTFPTLNANGAASQISISTLPSLHKKVSMTNNSELILPILKSNKAPISDSNNHPNISTTPALRSKINNVSEEMSSFHLNNGSSTILSNSTKSSLKIIPSSSFNHVYTFRVNENKTSSIHSNNSINFTGFSSVPRFPLFGTPAFNKTCAWAINQTRPISPNCTLFTHISSENREGISSWIGLVITGFVMAKQAGCSLRAHYANSVNISQIFRPTGILDWRLPLNFSCDTACFLAEYAYGSGGTADFRRVYTNHGRLAAVPSFRNPYVESFPKHERGLQESFGSTFQLANSMGCAMGVLFQPSPDIVKFQPDFYTSLLPKLRDPDALVLCLYIRTGHTEHRQISEFKERYRSKAELIVQCALQLENHMLQIQNWTKVVWMVVTDSQYMKQWITEDYTYHGSAWNRTILCTRTRGAHTKATIVPSTADFVEGFLDWFLIGESDVVISDHSGPSFGNTASFRTARLHYKVTYELTPSSPICQKMEPAMVYHG